MAFIVLSPEIVEITEGDKEVQTLCLNINNSAIDVVVYFSESDLLQLEGGCVCGDRENGSVLLE